MPRAEIYHLENSKHQRAFSCDFSVSCCLFKKTNVVVKTVRPQVLSTHLNRVLNVHNSGNIKVSIGKAKPHLSHRGKKDHNTAPYRNR